MSVSHFDKLVLCFPGYGVGAAFGLFTSGVNPPVTLPDAPPQTAREVFRDMKSTTLSYAKNFAVVGGVFAAVECTVESVREKVLKVIV